MWYKFAQQEEMKSEVYNWVKIHPTGTIQDFLSAVHQFH